MTLGFDKPKQGRPYSAKLLSADGHMHKASLDTSISGESSRDMGHTHRIVHGVVIVTDGHTHPVEVTNAVG